MSRMTTDLAARDERERAMRARWASRRRRQIAYGTWQPFADPEPVREHIQNLRDFGLSLVTIATLAGEHPSSLSTLTQPGHAAYLKRIRPERAERILAVRFNLDGIPDGHRVNSAGTRRRIEALMRNGWSLAYIGGRLGVTTQCVYGYRMRDGVSAAVARAVRDLYDDLWDQQGPGTRVRRYAEKEGYPPPAAWDDDSIDDPNAEPNLGDDVTTNRGRPVEHVIEDIEWILEHDPLITSTELAQRLGYATKSAIQHALEPGRGNRPDLLARLARNAEVKAA